MIVDQTVLAGESTHTHLTALELSGDRCGACTPALAEDFAK